METISKYVKQFDFTHNIVRRDVERVLSFTRMDNDLHWIKDTLKELDEWDVSNCSFCHRDRSCKLCPAYVTCMPNSITEAQACYANRDKIKDALKGFAKCIDTSGELYKNTDYLLTFVYEGLKVSDLLHCDKKDTNHCNYCIIEPICDTDLLYTDRYSILLRLTEVIDNLLSRKLTATDLREEIENLQSEKKDLFREVTGFHDVLYKITYRLYSIVMGSTGREAN